MRAKFVDYTGQTTIARISPEFVALVPERRKFRDSTLTLFINASDYSGLVGLSACSTY